MQRDIYGTTSIFYMGMTWASIVFGVILVLFCVFWIWKRIRSPN